MLAEAQGSQPHLAAERFCFGQRELGQRHNRRQSSCLEHTAPPWGTCSLPGTETAPPLWWGTKSRRREGSDFSGSDCGGGMSTHLSPNRASSDARPFSHPLLPPIHCWHRLFLCPPPLLMQQDESEKKKQKESQSEGGRKPTGHWLAGRQGARDTRALPAPSVLRACTCGQQRARPASGAVPIAGPGRSRPAPAGPRGLPAQPHHRQHGRWVTARVSPASPKDSACHRAHPCPLPPRRSQVPKRAGVWFCLTGRLASFDLRGRNVDLRCPKAARLLPLAHVRRRAGDHAAAAAAPFCLCQQFQSVFQPGTAPTEHQSSFPPLNPLHPGHLLHPSLGVS